MNAHIERDERLTAAALLARGGSPLSLHDFRAKLECHQRVGHMRLQWIFGRLVLLYQMPKTGSQTLEATLRRAPLPIPVLRTHFLSPQNIMSLRAGLVCPDTDSHWKRDAQEQLTLISKLLRTLRLRKFLLTCGVPIPRVLVISAVRDVFSTALSSIFENHRLVSDLRQSRRLVNCEPLKAG